MSRLRNAPLLEVIFELRWDFSNSEASNFQYLQGDLYNVLKDSYPVRESLNPGAPVQVFINSPMYRFRRVVNGYPLLQVGPGIVCLNTIDSDYEWDEYFNSAVKLTETLFEVYPEVRNGVKPSLIYFDFFKLDFAKVDVFDYLKANLHIDIQQTFFTPDGFPLSATVGFSYKTQIGKLDILLNSGKNQKGENGLITRIQLNDDSKLQNIVEIKSWLIGAHDMSRKLFKSLTEGKLYDSFN